MLRRMLGPSALTSDAVSTQRCSLLRNTLARWLLAVARSSLSQRSTERSTRLLFRHFVHDFFSRKLQLLARMLERSRAEHGHRQGLSSESPFEHILNKKFLPAGESIVALAHCPFVSAPGHRRVILDVQPCPSCSQETSVRRLPPASLPCTRVG